MRLLDHLAQEKTTTPSAKPRSRVNAQSPKDGRRRRMVRLAWGIVVPLVFLAALVIFLLQQGHLLENLKQAPTNKLVQIGLLFILGHFLNSTEFWLLYRATGTRYPLIENWMLFTSGQLVNHLPGQLGTAYRIQYMKAVHAVPYVRSAVVYAANLVITLAAAGVLGAAGVVWFGVAHPEPPSMPLLMVFVLLTTLAVTLSLLPLPSAANRTGPLHRLWERLREGFIELRRLPRTALTVGGVEVVKYFVTAWRIQVTFALVGINQPISFFLVLAPVAAIAGFIALTPGALGFREAFVTGAAAALGLDATEGLFGATIDRAVILIAALTLGGLGLALTYPRLRAAVADAVDR